MADRTYASWVEPIAAKLRDSRREIVVAAQSMPEETWTKPSPNEPWTYKDLLAHLATGDWVCQTVLNASIQHTAMTPFVGESIAEGNQQRLDERRQTSAAHLLSEVEAEGEETQEMLSLLTEDQQSLMPAGGRMNLGDYLRGFHMHDERHLAELLTAEEAPVE